jgi:hypothetical protein
MVARDARALGRIIPREKRDRAFTEKLRGEANGVLAWLFDGLTDWIQHGLVPPDEVARAIAECTPAALRAESGWRPCSHEVRLTRKQGRAGGLTV